MNEQATTTNIDDLTSHDKIKALLTFMYHRDRLSKEYYYFAVSRTLFEKAIDKETADKLVKSLFNKNMEDVKIEDLTSKYLNPQKRDAILCGCVKEKLIDWNDYYDIRKGIKGNES